MATLELQDWVIKYAIDEASKVVASQLLSFAKENVPRDKKRLPKPIKLKFRDKPLRNIRKGNKKYYRPPVMINWEWYEWVTGNLKKSLSMEKTDDFEYSVGVQEWPTEDYWYKQEYWDTTTPARSYLRKSLEENKEVLLEQFNKTVQEILNNW
jgi:hypothetical protein